MTNKLFQALMICGIGAGLWYQSSRCDQLTTDSNNAAAWVLHTQEVLTGIAAIQNTELRSEDYERGYVISGEPSFLVDYKAALKETDQSIRAVEALTIDNSNQQTNIGIAHFAIAARFTRMSGVIDTYQRLGEKPARTIISSRISINQRRDVANAIETMRSEEGRLILTRAAIYRKAMTTVERSVFLMRGWDAVLILAVLCVVWWKPR